MTSLKTKVETFIKADICEMTFDKGCLIPFVSLLDYKAPTIDYRVRHKGDSKVTIIKG